MDAALTNILQDKESQLRLVDLFPDRSSVFLLREDALRRAEEHLSAAVEVARTGGVTLEELSQTLTILYGEETL